MSRGTSSNRYKYDSVIGTAAAEDGNVISRDSHIVLKTALEKVEKLRDSIKAPRMVHFAGVLIDEIGQV
jgi:hypothetical protein